MRRVLILAGPTASGKTTLAIELAKMFNAEIVGADSRQIYRGMTIGTAAPSDEERAQVPHHVVGFLDPSERYTAARYARDAIAAIRDIHARGKHVIVVGGTGFYLRALTGGVELAHEYDPEVRQRLAAEARIHPLDFLHGWLALRDPARARAIDPNDRYRVLRALEVAFVSRANALNVGPSDTAPRDFTFAGMVLDVPLKELDERINARTERMLAVGLLEEAVFVGAEVAAASAVGYPQARAYLRGWGTRAELAASLARATRRYARRQRAWFRNEPAYRWVARNAVAECARELLANP